MLENANSSEYSFFVGIDISQRKFDAALIDLNGKKIGHKKFDNNQVGFVDFFEWLEGIAKLENALFTMEHTGIYSRNLWIFLQENECRVWMESGFQIHRGSGIKKTKNDKVDAYFIAAYALDRKYKAKLSHFDENICLLHDLLTNRNRLAKALKAIEVPISEMKKYGNKLSVDALIDVNNLASQGLKQSIKAIEKKIDELIKTQAEWKENIDLACSVPGVGKWVACWVLVYTKNFSDEYNARKFASLAGIAPFEFNSGSSIKRNDHTSHFSHKYLKGILFLAAMSAIRMNPKMKKYFDKKKKEGKKGFLPMNNVKNKIIQTMFAVVKLKKPFDTDFVHKLAA